jgi:hypothetical protein
LVFKFYSTEEKDAEMQSETVVCPIQHIIELLGMEVSFKVGIGCGFEQFIIAVW